MDCPFNPFSSSYYLSLFLYLTLPPLSVSFSPPGQPSYVSTLCVIARILFTLPLSLCLFLFFLPLLFVLLYLSPLSLTALLCLSTLCVLARILFMLLLSLCLFLFSFSTSLSLSSLPLDSPAMSLYPLCYSQDIIYVASFSLSLLFFLPLLFVLLYLSPLSLTAQLCLSTLCV